MSLKLCKIPNQKDDIYLFGSGGSKTIIVISKGHVYKYFPIFLYWKDNEMQKEKLKIEFEKELAIQNILTKEILLERKTPHIVAFYQGSYCDKVPYDFFKVCPNYVDFMLKNEKSIKNIPYQCDLLYRDHPQKLERGFYSMELEYCSYDLSKMMEDILKKDWIEIEFFLNRVIFQIAFTLAVLQENYPYFVHGDCFIRNILGFIVNSYKKEDYILYKFQKNEFYVEANGFISKLNDFGLTQLDDYIIKHFPNFRKLVKNPKMDMFCFLIDIYNGPNLGSKSMIKLIEDSKKSKKQKKDLIKKINEYFKTFINVDIIQKIKKNPIKDIHLKWDWSSTLDNNVSDLYGAKTPKEVLEIVKNRFKKVENMNIVEIFNENIK